MEMTPCRTRLPPEPRHRPCFASSAASGKHRAESCRKRNAKVKKACQELMGIVGKYDLPCNASTARTESPSRASPSFKVRGLKRSQSDFLNDLNKFIDRELEARFNEKDREYPNAEANLARADVKLRVFREAFYVVQQNVPSYRTVLARIEGAYEEAIALRDVHLSDRAMMRSALMKMQKDVEGQKAAIWEDAMFKVVGLLHDKLDLIRLIDATNNDKEKLLGVVEEMSRELELSHSKLLEEIDARRLVAYELSQLNEQIEILRNKAKGPVQKPEKTEDADSATDPVVLQMALGKCREALAKAQARVTYMETVYDDVCPLRDYEALQRQYRDLGKSNAKLVTQIYALEKQIRGLEREMEESALEREHLAYRLKEMEAASTPRFDWSLCAQFVPGGIEAWRKLTDGKSSSDKFNALIKYLTNRQQAEGGYFAGLGTEPDVPPHLRYEGRIVNRKYWLRDVRMLVHDVWKSKMAAKSSQSMSSFLADYAANCYPIASLQAELTYNLAEGCRAYGFDEQVKLFNGVLQGRLDEDLYVSQLADMERLREAVAAKVQAVRSRAFVTGAAFCDAVRQTFPLKSEKDVMAMLEAATLQLGISIGKNMNVGELFADCEEGIEEKALGREMGDQLRAARRKYAAEIVQAAEEMAAAAAAAAEEGGADGVTPELLARAIANVENGIDEQRMRSYLRSVFSAATDADLDTCAPVSANVLAARLERIDVRRQRANKPQETRSEP